MTSRNSRSGTRFQRDCYTQSRTEERAVKIEDLEDDGDSYAYWILSTLAYKDH